MLDFDFMLIGIELIGDKIRDTPTGEPQQEEWTQMPLDSQGPDLTPPSPLQVILVVDKGLITPPQSSEED